MTCIREMDVRDRKHCLADLRRLPPDAFVARYRVALEAMPTDDWESRLALAEADATAYEKEVNRLNDRMGEAIEQLQRLDEPNPATIEGLIAYLEGGLTDYDAHGRPK